MEAESESERGVREEPTRESKGGLLSHRAREGRGDVGGGGAFLLTLNALSFSGSCPSNFSSSSSSSSSSSLAPADEESSWLLSFAESEGDGLCKFSF